MEKIKTGIIGAGLFGNVHAKTFSEMPYVEITSVCDVNLQRAQKLAAEYGAKEIFTDIDEMAAKSSCDFVSVVTPDHLHAKAVIAAANGGKDILVEKPFGTTRADLEAMREAIARNGVRAMCDLHNRMSPPFSSAKTAIDSGELGTVQSMYMRLNDNKSVATNMLSWSANSSILWFLGSHSLDAISYLCNSRAKTVFAQSKEGVLKGLGIDTVDLYQTAITFENGVIAQMENGWITPNGNTSIIDLKCNVLCEKGMININTSNSDMLQILTEERTRTPDCIARPVIDGRMTGFANNSIRTFVDRLIDGKPFFVTIDQAADCCIALLAIMESAKTNQAIEVQY